MRAPWKAFCVAMAAALSAIAFLVWKLLADKSRLDRQARLAAVEYLGYYDVQRLRTPEEHRKEFVGAVGKATAALVEAKRSEIEARFENAFGGGK